MIVRWRVGKPSFSQLWTEAVGRTMRAHETPAEVEARFNKWLRDMMTHGVRSHVRRTL